ncbi:hypothetical protein [Caulobacter sp. B11]|uniref:hypothetical protein n=1 Tax=Caulobacter sp. B11 TaxID=2048899 RepID=UPI0013748155|nr:hypothetical protein [Caulobacter sp. B11]
MSLDDSADVSGVVAGGVAQRGRLLDDLPIAWTWTLRRGWAERAPRRMSPC